MKKNNIFLVILLSLGLLLNFNTAQANSLNGRILLQVHDRGQAWYVNPLDSQRYFLGRPDDAFRIMRDFGLGVSNRDLNLFLNSRAPNRLAGRILLKVEDKGQAFYVEPLSLKLHYLGKPLDAFNVIRSLGLGISNADLSKIRIALKSAPEPSGAPQITHIINDFKERRFDFKYKNTDYYIYLNLSSSLYNSYSKLPKVFSYFANNPPDNIREAFYDMFLQVKPEDTSIDDLISKLTAIANQRGWSQDELLEFALAFIQYIPYDHEKVASGVNNPFYSYETLYLNKGVCSDKTFLAHIILSRLGYGVAIMDFPDINHSAIGISCPIENSISGSGYCYAETTNYFPISVIPNNINGQAQGNDFGFTTLFDESKLGTIEILNKTTGRMYQGAATVKNKVNTLNTLHQEIISTRDGLGHDRRAIIAFNEKVNLFNQLLRDFYQQ